MAFIAVFRYSAGVLHYVVLCAIIKIRFLKSDFRERVINEADSCTFASFAGGAVRSLVNQDIRHFRSERIPECQIGIEWICGRNSGDSSSGRYPCVEVRVPRYENVSATIQCPRGIQRGYRSNPFFDPVWSLGQRVRRGDAYEPTEYFTACQDRLCDISKSTPEKAGRSGRRTDDDSDSWGTIETASFEKSAISLEETGAKEMMGRVQDGFACHCLSLYGNRDFGYFPESPRSRLFLSPKRENRFDQAGRVA